MSDAEQDSMIRLTYSQPQLSTYPISVKLPASKSESNRVLLLQKLAGGDLQQISNLAASRDTETMYHLLSDNHTIYDVKDAGTTCRFLTAYLAVTGQRCTIDGTARMRQRPIGILVEALRTLGADIDYLSSDGYLPLEFKGFTYSGISTLTVKADISSQYISALLMVGALLPEGLTVKFDGPLTSRPYLEMTAELIRQFGGQVTFDLDHDIESVRVEHTGYQPLALEISPDWSAAGYWYSIVALHPDPAFAVLLNGLSVKSLQGDRRLVAVFEHLGIKSEQKEEGLILSKDYDWQPVPEPILIDCSDIPDQAQTIAVAFPAAGQTVRLTGLHTLRIKETDRIAALQAELPKVGLEMLELADDLFEVRKSYTRQMQPEIQTYHDHRMAMSFAPIALQADLWIQDPSVIIKSYPDFWESIISAGLVVSTF